MFLKIGEVLDPFSYQGLSQSPKLSQTVDSSHTMTLSSSFRKWVSSLVSSSGMLSFCILFHQEDAHVVDQVFCQNSIFLHNKVGFLLSPQ